MIVPIKGLESIVSDDSDELVKPTHMVLDIRFLDLLMQFVEVHVFVEDFSVFQMQPSEVVEKHLLQLNFFLPISLDQ